MTLHLTENTNRNELKQSCENIIIFLAKLDPTEAKTNLESGLNNIYKIMPVLEIMSEKFICKKMDLGLKFH